MDLLKFFCGGQATLLFKFAYSGIKSQNCAIDLPVKSFAWLSTFFSACICSVRGVMFCNSLSQNSLFFASLTGSLTSTCVPQQFMASPKVLPLYIRCEHLNLLHLQHLGLPDFSFQLKVSSIQFGVSPLVVPIQLCRNESILTSLGFILLSVLKLILCYKSPIVSRETSTSIKFCVLSRDRSVTSLSRLDAYSWSFFADIFVYYFVKILIGKDAAPISMFWFVGSSSVDLPQSF